MRIRFILLSVVLAVVPWAAAADDHDAGDVFTARVVEILEQQTETRDNGSTFTQQDLRLEGLQGEWRGRTIVTQGVSDIEILASRVYRVGEKVLVQRVPGVDGSDAFYVVDAVRTGSLAALALVFALVVVAIGRRKGLRALVSLAASYAVIMWFILPRLLAGANPLLVSVLGGFAILTAITYLTEGWSKQSHVALLAMLVSLVATYLIAVLFTTLAQISGTAQEEVLVLADAATGALDFRGLLLAAIIIGTLGVLDDAVISQVETVAQLRQANPGLSARELYRRASAVGTAHLGAIINTLFLAYVGASLPLLLLFSLRTPPFTSTALLLNSELIATEIVKTLVGSIGLALAVPIATALAAYVPHSRTHPR
ncbi:MAG: YibE/F family protein [Parcubacteria group bacterium Gr01-1014_31]|nr:MAG: YibE/F family protein [Parcubacteria group bacterium Gr01-1014_31]